MQFSTSSILVNGIWTTFDGCNEECTTPTTVTTLQRTYISSPACPCPTILHPRLLRLPYIPTSLESSSAAYIKNGRMFLTLRGCAVMPTVWEMETFQSESISPRIVTTPSAILEDASSEGFWRRFSASHGPAYTTILSLHLPVLQSRAPTRNGDPLQPPLGLGTFLTESTIPELSLSTSESSHRLKQAPFRP